MNPELNMNQESENNSSKCNGCGKPKSGCECPGSSGVGGDGPIDDKRTKTATAAEPDKWQSLIKAAELEPEPEPKSEAELDPEEKGNTELNDDKEENEEDEEEQISPSPSP